MTDIFDKIRADFTAPFKNTATDFAGKVIRTARVCDARGHVILTLTSPLVNLSDRCALAAKIADILNQTTQDNENNHD